jgi:hypothetical protein
MSKSVKEILVTPGKGKAKRQKGGGAKKIGRSKVKCARYKGAGIREKNKKRKIAKDAKAKADKKAKKEAP